VRASAASRRRRLDLLALVVGALGLAGPRALGAQAPCAPLPPPGGATIEVTSAQAGQLRDLVASAASGTTILLHDGFYDLSGGDAASRLTFTTPGVALRSFSGDRNAVVLDGAYQTSELISILASDVTIADLTLRRAYDHPVHVSGNGVPITGVRLYDLRIVDPGQQAVKVNPIGEGWVDDGALECSSIELTTAGRAEIRDNCYTGGIDAHAARGWIVRRNRFSGFWCPTGLSEHAIHFWKTSRDTLVEGNLILDCARGIGFGLGATGDGRVYPDDPYPGFGYLGHIDGVIRDNFVAAADPDLFASEYGFDSGIAVEQARVVAVVHNSVASSQAPFSSIEWRFASTLATVADDLVSHNLRARDGAQATLEANLESAPLAWFADVASGDLHLAGPALPPVDAGVVLAGALAGDDFDGQPRDVHPDIGADEVRTELFRDGFESGDTSAWSAVQP
jgi:hypothetical protein